MKLTVRFGQDELELEVSDGAHVPVRRKNVAQPVANISEAARAILAAPVEFPPLRSALTPDDHIAIVARPDLNQFVALLQPVLETLLDAGIALERAAVVFTESLSEVQWRERLPEMLRGVPVEIHDPADRRKLSYLASTKAGRRIYLNRSVVDADQIVALGRVSFDPIFGYGGGLSDIFPNLSDESTRQEFTAKTTTAIPGSKPWPTRQEAEEIGWLLGMPFLIQIVEGEGDSIDAVLAGGAAAVSAACRRLLDEHWRATVPRSADLVIAGIGGSASGQTFENVARSLAAAARVVQPGGRILVLTHAQGDLGPGLEMLRSADSAPAGLRRARDHKAKDVVGVWQLAEAAQHAKLSLLSDWPGNVVEELFMTPLDNPGQVQRLVDAAESCIYLPDAHRTLAVIAEDLP